MRRPPTRAFRFWASCIELTSEIVHFITKRGTQVSYATFARHADLAPLRQQDHPAMYRISASDNWSISFWKTTLPSGAPAYYFAWSGIEHVFVDRDVDVATEHGMADVVPVLPRIAELARTAEEECEGYDWCGAAVDLIEAELGDDVAGYFPDLVTWGGISIDASHAYLVTGSGTIIDPTVTQFVRRRGPYVPSMDQVDVASGFPFHPDFPSIAVVPLGHPYIDKMGYESHIGGRGWSKRPRWWQGPWPGPLPAWLGGSGSGPDENPRGQVLSW